MEEENSIMPSGVCHWWSEWENNLKDRGVVESFVATAAAVKACNQRRNITEWGDYEIHHSFQKDG